MFTVFEVPAEAAELSEQMGTKFKFWYEDIRGLTLFKEGRVGTGENWAEKLACELALMLQLPHAYYEFATWRGRRGTISPAFIDPRYRLVPGNELLGGRTTGRDDVRYYHERSQTLSAVLAYFKSKRPLIPMGFDSFPGVTEAVDFFVGYLMFDAWIGNQDRHSENWGAVRTPGNTIYLAPSFDHGSALASHITDDQRERRLNTKDSGYALPSFVAAAKSALYPKEARSKKVKAIGTLEAFEQASKQRPAAGRAWQARLIPITAQSIREAIEMVPDEYMSAICREFTLQFLLQNKERLISLRI